MPNSLSIMICAHLNDWGLCEIKKPINICSGHKVKLCEFETKKETIKFFKEYNKK